MKESFIIGSNFDDGNDFYWCHMSIHKVDNSEGKTEQKEWNLLACALVF